MSDYSPRLIEFNFVCKKVPRTFFFFFEISNIDISLSMSGSIRRETSYKRKPCINLSCITVTVIFDTNIGSVSPSIKMAVSPSLAHSQDQPQD